MVGLTVVTADGWRGITSGFIDLVDRSIFSPGLVAIIDVVELLVVFKNLVSNQNKIVRQRRFGDLELNIEMLFQ